MGGLGIPDPSSALTINYQNSILVTSPLVSLILDQSTLIPYNLDVEQSDAKKLIRSNKNRFLSELADSVMLILSSTAKAF